MKKALLCCIELSVFILLFALSPHAIAQLTFQPFYSPEKTFSVGEMKLGDFDGDSFQDAVYVNVYNKQILFIYHISNPALRSTQAISVNSGHTGNLYHLDVKDVNGDGKDDLAIIETSSLGINLMVFLSTGNSFSQQTITLSDLSNYRSLKIIDFNKDGSMDIAIATTKNIIFYKGDGHGTFTLTSPQPSSTAISPGGNEQVFDVADINHDGATDLVVYSADTLYTFTNGSNGGSFTATKLRAPGLIPSAIKMGDLNGDNFPEVAVISVAGGTAKLLEFGNNSGTYAAPLDLSVSGISGTRSLDIADFDSDGKNDVLLGGGDYATAFLLLKNNGSNSFTNVAPPSNNSPFDDFISFSDIDHDGNLEIVALSSYKSINLYTLSGGNYQYADQIVLGTDADRGIVSDLNNDNLQDIVVYSAFGEFVSYFYGTGNKTFGKPTYLSSNSTIGAVAVDDFNKDSYKDILIAEKYASYGSFIKLVASDNTGTLTAPVPVTVTSPVSFAARGSYALVSADFNGDGNMDFATDHGTYLSNGNGTFTVQSYTLPFVPTSMATGKFNSDNALDLVFNDGNKNYVSLNDGAGTFSTFTPINQFYKTVKSALINNDTYNDLVSIQYNAGNFTIDVLLCNGDGTFTISQTISPPASDQFTGYADAADVDNDGRVDIVAGINNHDYGSAVYLQDNQGNFNFSQTIPVSSIIGGVYAPDFIQVVDTNADGKKDVVMFSSGLLDPIDIAINDLVAQPTLPPTVALTDKTDVSATFSLTTGDGNAVLVVIRKIESQRSLPADNTFYSASAQFGSGTQLGTGSYAVVLKDTASISITGLTQGSSYTVTAYACNKNLGKTFVNYLTTAYDSVNFSTKKTQTLSNPGVEDKIIGSDPFALTVTSSAGLPVTLTAETTTISITSNTVTLVEAGPAKINASSDATADYAAASQEISFCVDPLVPTITITENADHSYVLTSSSDTNNHWLLNGAVIDSATHKTYHTMINGIYAVQVEAGTCVSVSTPTTFLITAVERQPAQVVYPNPFTDFIFLSGAGDAVNVQMIGISGQAEPVTVDRENDLWRVNAQSLSPGLHLLRMQTSGAVSYFKVVKRQ